MNLYISQLAKNTVGNSILLSGSARSGTTIIGKIIHSFENVEYVFEPPLLFSLISLIDSLSESNWKLLYETYLYEEFYINSICGRSINCNRIDDSSIYKVKDNTQIENRLKNSLGKNEAEEIGKNRILAYKLPDIIPFIPNILNYYPTIRVIIIKRDAIDTINSLLTKKWFHDDSLKTNQIWPFRIYEEMHVPYWVREEDDQKWLKMNEIDRCAYYYVRVSEGIEKIHTKIEISYRELLKNPIRVVSILAERLCLKFGAKTKELIDEVKPTNALKDYGIIDKINFELAKDVKFYSSQP
ncbi:MAG: sulfotransferase [Desulfamplus sp.]|nr:sulfotransferase [Desulfamplus sp.]